MCFVITNVILDIHIIVLKSGLTRRDDPVKSIKNSVATY
jgi:hypothetical protein